MERKENATKDENVKKGDSWLVVDTNESLLVCALCYKLNTFGKTD